MKIEKNGNANQTNDQEQVNQSDAPWLAWLNIALDAYQEDERSRVDRLKHDIASDPDDEILDRYQQERDFRKPSTLRKVGRVALDVMRIHPQSSEQRRDQEAMSLAISEHDAETKSQRQWRDWVQKKQAVSERLRREEEDRKEAEALERDMVEAMDVMRQRSHELTIGQRNQEIIEREINSRLLTVDKLEEEVLSGSHEVNKGVIDYDGAQIPIYHLRGIPFSMLSHAVDFRRPSWQNEGHIGVGTSKVLFDDPSIWSKHEEDALADKSYAYDDYNTRGNLISVSYINSESNIDAAYKGELRYGFSKTPSGSFLDFQIGDGGTPNYQDSNEIDDSVRDINYNDVLDGLNYPRPGRGGYNEVLLKRYSDTGLPLLPSYIITESGEIADQALRHAKYFNIPIVDINREIYDKKYEDHIEKLIDSLGRDADYVEVARVNDLIHMVDYSHNWDKHRGNYWRSRHYKESYDDPTRKELKRQFDKENEKNDRIGDDRSRYINQCITRISQLEYDKRTDFIVSKINDIADVYRKANERGEVINYHDLDIGEGVTEVKGFDVTYYKSYSQGELCLDGHEKDVEGCPYMLLDEIHTKFILPSNLGPVSTEIANFPNPDNPDENDPTFGKLAKAFFECYEAAKQNRQLAKPESDTEPAPGSQDTKEHDESGDS